MKYTEAAASTSHIDATANSRHGTNYMADLEIILRDANLPTLVLSLVHLTGDTSLLKDQWKPSYSIAQRGVPLLSDEVKDEILAAARAILVRYDLDNLPQPKTLDEATIRRMMNFIAGAEIPANYYNFLRDELGIQKERTKGLLAPIDPAVAENYPVVVIGAGMSGLLAGVRLKEAGFRFTILEKNLDVGGTWLENTYPGCRVDTWNHMYSYSFSQRNKWPHYFSEQRELLKYFRGVADDHDLRKNIQFETEVKELLFDDERRVWRILIQAKNAEELWIEARAVIAAVGQLNKPVIPGIKGQKTFRGAQFHSAQWDHSIDLAGKRVAVVGTGASAFQFVPEIAKVVQSMAIFQRSPPWGFPMPSYHASVPDGFQWALEHLPYYQKWYRFFLFWIAMDGALDRVTVDPEWAGPKTAVSSSNQDVRQMVIKSLEEKTGDDRELLQKVIPDYPIGGKRPLMDNGAWIETLRKDIVDLVTSPIAEIAPTGVSTVDGRTYDADVIIYATGFNATGFLLPMKVTGKGGRDLHQYWDGEPRAYLGISVPHFPNLFILYGPNTNIVVSGSIVFFSECAMNYILSFLRLMVERRAEAVEVREDVMDRFIEKIDAANKLRAWGVPQVSSWYKSKSGRVTQNWPLGFIDYWSVTRAPDPQDYRIDGSGHA